jgi:hypothetical protein
MYIATFPSSDLLSDRIIRMWKQRFAWQMARKLQNGNHLADIDRSEISQALLKEYPWWFKDNADAINTINELVPEYLKTPYGSAIIASNIGADYFAFIPTLWRFLGLWGSATIIAIVAVLPNGAGSKLIELLELLVRHAA